MLRTASPLLCGAHLLGDEAEERKILLSWAGVIRSSRQRLDPDTHPVLYHIGVYYSFGDPFCSVVSHWSNKMGIWKRTSLLVNPPLDYDFI